MNIKTSHYVCSCFFSRNIYIKKFKLHVTFKDEQQFYKDFRQILRMKGCSTDKQYEDILEEIKEEVARRKSYHNDAEERQNLIATTYRKLHPAIWKFQESFVDEKLKSIIQSMPNIHNKQEVENLIVQNNGEILGNYLYRVPVFKADFCHKLVEELNSFEQSLCPKGRPNTMSDYGVSLDEMGLSLSLLTPVMEKYIQPLTDILFHECCFQKLDSFRAFSVLYSDEKDKELSLHFDNAEITLNVCLTTNFEGGELEFKQLWDEPSIELENNTVQHKLGAGVIHLGKHMHQAVPIKSGCRCNLIMWMRSSQVRNRLCPMCGLKPDLFPVPFAGDGFIPTTTPQDYSCLML